MVDDVSFGLANHLVRPMKRPALFLGCLSETKLHLFLHGAEVAMGAMDETPRFATFLDAVHEKWSGGMDSRLRLLPKSPDGLSYDPAGAELEEKFLADFLDVCRSKMAGEYKDLLVSLITRADDVADYYLWF